MTAVDEWGPAVGKVLEQLHSREQDYVKNMVTSRSLESATVAALSVNMMRALQSKVTLAEPNRAEKLMLKITSLHAGLWCGEVVPRAAKVANYVNGDED